MNKNYFKFNLTSLLCCIFLFSSIACASSDKRQVEKTYDAWCAAIGTAKGNAKIMTAFYAPDAVLLPTLSFELLLNHDGGLDSYFAGLTSKPDIQCKTDKLSITTTDDIAINYGLYTFSYMDHGQIKKIPARFSFVYKKFGDRWLIINHHSSKLPS